jgi:hypothetical protein
VRVGRLGPFHAAVPLGGLLPLPGHAARAARGTSGRAAPSSGSGSASAGTAASRTSTQAQARSAGAFTRRRSTGKTPATASMTNLAGSAQRLSAGGTSARSASASFRRAATRPRNPAESIRAQSALRLPARPEETPAPGGSESSWPSAPPARTPASRSGPAAAGTGACRWPAAAAAAPAPRTPRSPCRPSPPSWPARRNPRRGIQVARISSRGRARTNGTVKWSPGRGRWPRVVQKQ